MGIVGPTDTISQAITPARHANTGTRITAQLRQRTTRRAATLSLLNAHNGHVQPGTQSMCHSEGSREINRQTISGMATTTQFHSPSSAGTPCRCQLTNSAHRTANNRCKRSSHSLPCHSNNSEASRSNKRANHQATTQWEIWADSDSFDSQGRILRAV